MSKRISDLTASNVVAPDDQIEIAMVDESSPTGYVSRRIPASLLGGTMPFRYIVDEEFTLDGYGVFEISFSFDELIRSMNYDGGFESLSLGGGQFRFNLQGMFKTGGSSNYNHSVVCQTDVFYRENDPSRAIFYNTQESTPSGIEMYNLPRYTMPNNENYANYLFPSAVFTYDSGTLEGGITIEFRTTGTNNIPDVPSELKLYGYVDVVVSTYPPGV